MAEILVLCEHANGGLREVTLELLSLARSLAGDEHQVVAVLLEGDVSESLVDRLQGLAHRIVAVRSPELAVYAPDPYLAVLAPMCVERQPLLTMIGHTTTGIDLAPALATRLGRPLSSDCVDVSLLPGGHLEVLRHEYGGKIRARLSLKPASGYLVTVRPGCGADEPAKLSSQQVEQPAPPENLAGRGRRFIERIEVKLEDVDIAEASILVAVGRGIGKPENLPLVESFAERINATVACSRPVADKGWLPKSRQVGTSGKVVHPDIYIAFGISGAYQHVAGMRNAKTIIAVNSDPMAPIFDVAHYGIVADLVEVLPELAACFKG